MPKNLEGTKFIQLEIIFTSVIKKKRKIIS